VKLLEHSSCLWRIDNSRQIFSKVSPSRKIRSHRCPARDTVLADSAALIAGVADFCQGTPFAPSLLDFGTEWLGTAAMLFMREGSISVIPEPMRIEL
jgi:hypothetical protein